MKVGETVAAMYRKMKLDRYSRLPRITAAAAAATTETDDMARDRQLQEEAMWTQRMQHLKDIDHYDNVVNSTSSSLCCHFTL